MVGFTESNFYKALQDFFINNNKDTFLQMLSEFYNRTESIIDKNNIQDDLIKELRELYLEFNEKGIDNNIVREKVNYFLENSLKIKDINSKLNINTNKIEDVNAKLETNTNNIKNNIENITSQLDTIETKKANQSSFNNLRNQVNNLVLESGGDSNLEVVQSRVSNGFTYKNLDNRLINFENVLKDGIFNIELFDLVNNSITSSTGELGASSPIRVTTNSKYNVSLLKEFHLRINKLSGKRIIYAINIYDENGLMIPSSTGAISRVETDSYYDYVFNVNNYHFIRFLFKYEDNSEITINDVYSNVSIYFYNEDRISKINDELNNMCYDNLGNKYSSPSDLIKDYSSIIAHNKNLFDKSSNDNVIGYINGAGGGIDNNTNYKTSYFIKGLKKNEKYIITPKIRKFLAYDENNKPITTTYIDANTNNYVFTMDSSWDSIRFTYYVSDEDKMMLSQGEEPQTYVDYGYMFGKNLSFNDYQREEIKEIAGTQGNKLENKILFNFGDSIAAGDGNNGKGYAKLLGKKYGLVVTDFAKGGATLGDTTSNNITSQVDSAIANGVNPDYILIEGGTNDIVNSVALGSIANDYNITNFVKTTTSGGLEYCLYKLKETYPNAKIVFVSVHKMGSRDYTKQTECQKRCIEICNKWGVPVADIGNSGNLNTFLPCMHKFTNPTSSQPNGDRTHPNDLGYKTFYLPIIHKILSSI